MLELELWFLWELRWVPVAYRSQHRRLSSPVFLRILVLLVVYDSEKVSLVHLVLSWYPSQSPPFLRLRAHAWPDPRAGDPRARSYTELGTRAPREMVQDTSLIRSTSEGRWIGALPRATPSHAPPTLLLPR